MNSRAMIAIICVASASLFGGPAQALLGRIYLDGYVCQSVESGQSDKSIAAGLCLKDIPQTTATTGDLYIVVENEDGKPKDVLIDCMSEYADPTKLLERVTLHSGVVQLSLRSKKYDYYILAPQLTKAHREAWKSPTTENACRWKVQEVGDEKSDCRLSLCR
ncbi:hypothetical protein [Bradyrhizobium sp. LB11.1]|uniref:hypothetical protein n=1 Tax=Bradyrhizobium sp. LB11.1 TaxID=3156326 RepID=UPI003394442C